MDRAYDETDLLRVNEFIEFVKRQQTHRKNYPDLENHCDTCRWTLSKLEALRKKTAEYAKMRKTDDDLIDWNILVLELLNEDTQSEEINSVSPPKRARLEPKPQEVPKNEAEEGIGSKIEKLMAEKKAKEEADEIYNFEMDSFDDDEPEESGEDQEDEENEEEDQDDAMEGSSEQVQPPVEPEQEAAEQPAEDAKVEQENEPKDSN
ncbi:unnamed protein product [Caenorhabditis brenneri]